MTASYPPSLDSNKFQENLRALHKTNDTFKHPASYAGIGDGVRDASHDIPGEVEAEQVPPPTRILVRAGQPPAVSFPAQHSVQHFSQAQPHNSGQEVTQYCPMSGCLFSSYKTDNENLLDTCVKQLTLHLQVEHGIIEKSTGDAANTVGRGDKTSREYQAATKARTITKVIDDATYNLTEGRFLPFPLDLKTLGMNMPIAITPVNTVVDFSHLGVDVTNADTVRKIHNRSSTVLRLRDFSDTNLRNYHAAGDELVAIQATKDQLQLGKKLKQLDDPQECVRAFYNFSAISRHFHVLDWSSMALLRLVLEKFFLRAAVEQFTRLFEKFVHENAVRAQRRAVPLTYQEVVAIWNTYINPSPMSISSIDTLLDNKVDKKFQLMQSASGSGGKGGRSRNPSQSPKRIRLTNDVIWCPIYNTSHTPPLCPNPPVQGGCLSNGKVFKHGCSRKINGRFCGSDKHNSNTH